jgi:hypothetical protein
METYFLKTSDRKGKRFVMEMPSLKHSHHFGSDVGKTFIEHGDLKKKSAWIARHKNDKGYNNKHSGIFYSKNLLWNKPTLKQSIKDVEKRFNIKIKLQK